MLRKVYTGQKVPHSELSSCDPITIFNSNLNRTKSDSIWNFAAIKNLVRYICNAKYMGCRLIILCLLSFYFAQWASSWGQHCDCNTHLVRNASSCTYHVVPTARFATNGNLETWSMYIILSRFEHTHAHTRHAGTYFVFVRMRDTRLWPIPICRKPAPVFCIHIQLSAGRGRKRQTEYMRSSF